MNTAATLLLGEIGQKVKFMKHLNVVGPETVFNICVHSRSFHSYTYPLYLFFHLYNTEGRFAYKLCPYNRRITLPRGMTLVSSPLSVTLF